MLSKVTGVLAAITFLIHFFVGGSDALAPVLAADLPAPAQTAMHACWHIVSFILAWSAYVFWNSRTNRIATRHFAIVWIAAGLVFVYVGLNQNGLSGLVANPQWTILLVTGTLAWISVAKNQNQPISKNQPIASHNWTWCRRRV